MRLLWKLVLPASLGLFVAYGTGFSQPQQSSLYPVAISILLAIGLYGSTSGLDLEEASQHRRMIFSAITIGVVLKAAIIGGTLALAMREPLFILLGIVVAQIDPLSVAEIVGHPRMSNRAKSILAAWSSFDDPIVAILTLYAVPIVVRLKQLPAPGFELSASYMDSITANTLFVFVAWAAWRMLRRWAWAQVGLVLVLLGVAVWQFTMLGLAITGLFIRPPITRYVSWAVQAALIGAAFMLGALLMSGVDLVNGILLGLAAFTAQGIVALVLTRHLSAVDRMHLAFAQQNGITAIVLALLLEQRFNGVVGIVAPAVITVNLVHLLVNALLDRRLPRPSG